MMTAELREEIEFELDLIGAAVREASAIYHEVGDKEPTLREKTAAAAFMAQFYGGIENVLKRIHRFHEIPLPTGDSWHIEIFRRFSSPGHAGLPVLFDERVAMDLAPYRAFRHVVYHSYGVQLDWDRMRDGLASLEEVHARVQATIAKFLDSLTTL